MTGQQAVRLIDRLLVQGQQRQLNDLESTIVLQIWDGNTYKSIACYLSYDLDYIKQIAARLWKSLSKLLNKNICKNNIKSVLARCQDSGLSASLHPLLVPDGETSSLLFSDDSANDDDRRNVVKTDLDNIQTWTIGDRRTTISFLSSTATNERSRSIKFDAPALQLCQQQIQSEIQSLIWRNLSEPATSTILIDEVFAVLKVRSPAENAINCLIVNCYFDRNMSLE